MGLDFPLAPANATFVIEIGCQCFTTITQNAINRFTPLQTSQNQKLVPTSVYGCKKVIFFLFYVKHYVNIKINNYK